MSKIPIITTLTADLALKLKSSEIADKVQLYHISNTIVSSFVRARVEKKNVEQTDALFTSLSPITDYVTENLG